jgi:hypothetical protein
LRIAIGASPKSISTGRVRVADRAVIGDVAGLVEVAQADAAARAPRTGGSINGEVRDLLRGLYNRLARGGASRTAPCTCRNAGNP